MLPRASAIILFVFSLSFLAVASPWGAPTVTVTVTAPGPTVTAASQCSTGDLQCCEQVESADSLAGSLLLGLLGIILKDVTLLIGATCSPITVIGIGGSSACSSNVVCCSDNAVGGLISIGCVPVIL
ncbi:fungal hydrophobin [Obba rivulosa]|uniref:Hydrophobin n=1 Tax=Obba rivulosa TaxID=1052685 RepID=A0A8E2DM20_9APHY|nr:fungal hydrophobin [Obba rivulosa]